jgi:hypothetical protein
VPSLAQYAIAGTEKDPNGDGPIRGAHVATVAARIACGYLTAGMALNQHTAA